MSNPRVRVLAIMLVGQVLAVLDISRVISGLLKRQSALALSRTSLAWVQSAYTLAFGRGCLCWRERGRHSWTARMLIVNDRRTPLILKALTSGIVAALTLTPNVARAQLSSCAAIAQADARLACYDDLARAEAARSSTTAAIPTQPESQSSAPAGTAMPGAASPPLAVTPSVMEARWELRPELKRGIFKPLAYKPLYGLIAWTSSPNDQPASPTRPFNAAQQVPLDRVEGKIQLSFKTKAVEGLLGTRGDLWLAYTQVSYWQFGNSKNSSPFRETNYEPEATYIYPLQLAYGDLRLRFIGLTLNHQSNGQSGSLSRSWNRLIGEAAAEYGPWSFHVRPWARVFASEGDRNDNPDIQDFTGRGELVVTRRAGAQVLTLTGRHSLRSGERSRGSAQLDWAFPLVGSLNAHVQIFSGYGLNLIDYNHRQTTVGLGVSFLD